MPIFKISSDNAKQIFLNQDHFKDEAKLRDFFADNLEELLENIHH